MPILKRTTAVLIWLLLSVFISACATDADLAPQDNEMNEPSSPEFDAAVSRRLTAGTTYEQITLGDGSELTYALVIPQDYDPNKPAPTLLALPPGPQTESMVQVGLDGYWETAASQRGWVVISPIAPNGTLFFQGSETLIPEFLARIAASYIPEGGKFHVAGVSNGGISGFRLTISQPDLYHSLIALPGLPRSEADFDQLVNLKDLPVAMFVGEQDTSWLTRMQETEDALSGLGGEVSLQIMPGEGHVIQSLTGGEALFDLLDSFR